MCAGWWKGHFLPKISYPVWCCSFCIGRPVPLCPIFGWHKIESCVLVFTPYTKTHLSFWCQLNIGIKVLCRPVGLSKEIYELDLFKVYPSIFPTLYEELPRWYPPYWELNAGTPVANCCTSPSSSLDSCLCGQPIMHLKLCMSSVNPEDF